ncbi:MAG: polysaccharide biosynthesis protein [Acholeplasmatales bacterium]
MERKTPKIIIKIELALMDLFIFLSVYFFIGSRFAENLSQAETMIRFGIFTIIISVLSLIALIFSQVYSMLIRHFGFQEILRISITIIGKNLIFMIFFLIFRNLGPFVFYVFLILIPLEITLIIFPRTIPRLVRYITQGYSRQNGLRTLIIGAGSGGYIVLKEIIDNKRRDNKAIGFVDDDINKIGSKMSGIKVYGPIREIKEIIRKTNAEEVIIAIKSLKPKALAGIINDIAECDVSVKKMQVLSDVSDSSSVTIVNVKVEDLLNREPISLDSEGISKFIKDKVILVTGGGGSIGSELCRQIVSYKPKRLVIFDIYENSTYEIQMELVRLFQKEPSLNVN